MRRGEPRSRRTHRTPRGEIRTRLYPKVWVTILPTLAPAQTLQSRLLGSTVCARSAQRLQSGGVLPAPDPPGPARALLSQRKRANEWEAGAPQRGAAKTSREEQRPTAGLAPAPRRLLRSQCSRGADGVTVANRIQTFAGLRLACAGERATAPDLFSSSRGRSFSCAKLISSSLPSTGHGAPPRPLNAPVTPPVTNAESFGKSGLGKGVAGGGAAVVARTRSPRRPRLINCAPRARRSARLSEERAPTTGDDGQTNGRPSGGRLPRVSREGTACRRRRRRRGRRSA